jgi:hypothetical protein
MHNRRVLGSVEVNVRPLANEVACLRAGSSTLNFSRTVESGTRMKRWTVLHSRDKSEGRCMPRTRMGQAFDAHSTKPTA